MPHHTGMKKPIKHGKEKLYQTVSHIRSFTNLTGEYCHTGGPRIECSRCPARSCKKCHRSATLNVLDPSNSLESLAPHRTVSPHTQPRQGYVDAENLYGASMDQWAVATVRAEGPLLNFRKVPVSDSQ